MESYFSFAQTKNFQDKRNFLKGSPKFPNGISERKMFVPFSSFYQFQAFRQFPLMRGSEWNTTNPRQNF